MQPKDCIFYILNRAAKRGQKVWHDPFDRVGLTGVQAMVMNVLLDEDGIPAGTLTDRANLDKASVTGVLKRLETKKLISRTRNENDGRSVLIRLTDIGRSKAQDVRKIVGQINQSFLSEFSPDETAVLKKLLYRL